MSHILKISDVTIGGLAVNNPGLLTQANYDLSGGELSLSFRQLNVIAYHTVLGVNMQVTALVQVDSVTGMPMVDDNDPAYMPCPPFCHVRKTLK